MEMKGLLGRIDLLKSMASPDIKGTPGYNPANMMVKPLTQAIKDNLESQLTEVFGGGDEGAKRVKNVFPDLEATAKAMAENYIKPDKGLQDIFDNTSPLSKMTFTAGAQNVYVQNWKEVRSGEQQPAPVSTPTPAAGRPVLPANNALIPPVLQGALGEFMPQVVPGAHRRAGLSKERQIELGGHQKAQQEGETTSAELAAKIKDLKAKSEESKFGIGFALQQAMIARNPNLANIKMDPMAAYNNLMGKGHGLGPGLMRPPVLPNPMEGYAGRTRYDAEYKAYQLHTGPNSPQKLDAQIKKLEQEKAAADKKAGQAVAAQQGIKMQDVEEKKKAQELDDSNRQRVKTIVDNFQNDISKFRQDNTKNNLGDRALEIASVENKFQETLRRIGFGDGAAPNDYITSGEIDTIQNLASQLKKAAETEATKLALADKTKQTVEGVATGVKGKDPISAALQAQADSAKVANEFQDSYTQIEASVKSFLESNKPFPDALKKGELGLKLLKNAIYGNKEAGDEATMTFETEADRIRYVKEQLMLLQNTMDMTAFENGRKTLKEVRDGLLQTIEVLTGEEKPITQQLTQLKKLEDARIKEARSTRNATSSSKFIQEASDQIIALGSDFAAVGISAKQADADIKTLQNLRDKLADGGMTAQQMKEFADKLEKLGLKAKEAKRKLGLISPQEFIDEFLKVWTNGQKRTVEVTKKALADLYRGIGDVDVDPEQRKKELGEKFAEVISGAIKDMSSEMEGQALSSAQEYFRLTGDQAAATQKLNQLDQERIFLFDMVSQGIITEAEAQRLYAESVRNATAETDKLSRELGYIDAKEFKERFIKRIQEGIQEGSVTAGEGIRRTFKQIGDLAISADLRESEIRKGLGTSISNAIATLSSDAIGENMNISTELYKVTGSLNLAQQQAINLDKTRVRLFRKLRRGSITLAQALEKMGEAQDKAAKRVDINKRKRGQQSEAEFIENESTRFNNALKRSGTDTGGALFDYFASITDLGGVFDATKMKEAKTQSAKSIGELLKKTVTEASAEAQSLANQLAGFERSGVEGMANRAAEETLKIRQKQKQVEMEFADGLISRVEADQKLAEINREATDRVTKLAMAVGTLSDAAGKSQLLDNRKADLNQRGVLDDTLFNQNRRQQFGLDQTIDQRFRNTEVGMGGMMMDRDADLQKAAVAAERDLVKQRFEQTGDYNNALSLATDLEKRRMEILAEGAKNGESLIEIERQLNFARMDTAAKGLGQALQNGSITADQYRQNIGALSEDLMNGSLEAADKTKVWKMELGALFAIDKNYGFKQLVAGTKDVFMTLREGIKGALKDVITGAKSMREALQGVFAAIADKMLDRTIGSLVDTIFYALMPRPYGMYNKGGQVKGYNGGGIVRGGSGVRDDVPAVLTRGEYVVRKRAVNKYGRGFIEQLNQGRIKKYADGGSANFSLMNQFDYNDPKRPTAGTMNVDSRMSALAQTDTNNPMNQLKFDKEKTLDSYLKEKAQYEEQKRQAMANYKKQRKGLIKQMFIQIGMMGLTYGINKAIANARLEKAALAKSKVSPLTGLRAGEMGPMTEIHTNKVEAFKADMGRIFGTGSKMDSGFAGFKALGNENVSGFLGNIAKQGPSAAINPFVAGRLNDIPTGSGFSATQVHAAAGAGKVLPVAMPEIKMKSKGGPMMGGRDNIPALLTGGEYVVNKQSVGKYGLDFFNKLNAGRLPGFNSGGLVGENNGSTRMTDGGGAPSNVNNNITINVTVEKDGNVNTDTTNEQAGGNQNTQGALNEEERNKQFSGAIKDAVVREIVEQKRPGGLLYNEKRSGT